MGHIVISRPMSDLPAGPFVLVGVTSKDGHRVTTTPVVSEDGESVSWTIPDNDHNREFFRNNLKPAGFVAQTIDERTVEPIADDSELVAVAAERDAWKARAEKAEAELESLKAADHAASGEASETPAAEKPKSTKK